MSSCDIAVIGYGFAKFSRGPGVAYWTSLSCWAVLVTIACLDVTVTCVLPEVISRASGSVLSDGRKVDFGAGET